MKEILRILPKWLLILLALYIALWLGFGVATGREVKFWPPSVGAKRGPEVDADKKPPTAVAPSPGWQYASFNDGSLAASWLTSKYPDMADVYAVVSGEWIHVWCRPGKSSLRWEYRYVPWNPQNPSDIPLPVQGMAHVPIGFGTANNGRQAVFIFFTASQ